MNAAGGNMSLQEFSQQIAEAREAFKLFVDAQAATKIRDNAKRIQAGEGGAKWDPPITSIVTNSRRKSE
jgi:hypothetical protein